MCLSCTGKNKFQFLCINGRFSKIQSRTVPVDLNFTHYTHVQKATALIFITMHPGGLLVLVSFFPVQALQMLANYL